MEILAPINVKSSVSVNSEPVAYNDPNTTTDVIKFRVMSSTDYAALGTKDPNTLYLVPQT